MVQSNKKHRQSNTKKSSTKKSSKVFSLQSRRVQFFVVVITVSILGGGWFLVRSFAALPRVEANASNSKSNQGYKLNAHDGARIGTDDAKGNNAAALIGYNQSVTTSRMPIRYNQIRPCITARSSSPASASFAATLSNTTAGAPTVVGDLTKSNIKVGTSYTDICLPWTRTDRSIFEGLLTNRTRNTTIYVSRIYYEAQPK